MRWNRKISLNEEDTAGLGITVEIIVAFSTEILISKIKHNN